MVINKAFKYRVYPDTKQKDLISCTFGCNRYIYNHFLNERENLYKDEKIGTNYVKQSKELTELKKSLIWLRDVDSTSLQTTLRNLDTAYKNFFSKRARYPKYKSKRTAKKAYTSKSVNNTIRVEGNYIRLPKVGFLKAKLHRQIPADFRILSATVSLDAAGRYFVSLSTAADKTTPLIPSGDKIIGLDFTAKDLFVSSENQRADYPKFFKQMEQKLSKEQRSLSRKVKFSNNWYKQKIKVAKVHGKIKDARADFLHKLSRELVNSYNAVIIEDLDVKKMSGTWKLGKSVLDSGWGMFTAMLQYKLEHSGKQLIKIDRFFPSSKTCSFCGLVKDDLKLQDRVFVCSCGASIDRDLNAAINIKRAGLSLLVH